MTDQVVLWLETDIIFVTGTVNGVSVEFSRIGQNLWAATAEKTADGLYTVHIEAYNSLGTKSVLDTVVSTNIGFIFDRTQQDLQNKTYKAYHNAADRNRIETDCRLINEHLAAVGYGVELELRKSWQDGEFPYQSEMARILRNIEKLRSAFYRYIDTPQTPQSMYPLGIQKANDIEKILSDVYMLYQNMMAAACPVAAFNLGGI